MTTRPATPADAAFLLALFAESGDAAAWIASTDPRLLHRQFSAQQSGYAAQFPGARHEIVVVDGEPAGHVRWIEVDREVRIIDVGVVPRCRRQGIAARVYDTILAHARARGKPARASVARLNAVSLAFHARLGFVTEAETDTHFVLVAPAVGVQA